MAWSTSALWSGLAEDETLFKSSLLLGSKTKHRYVAEAIEPTGGDGDGGGGGGLSCLVQECTIGSGQGRQGNA